MHQQDFVEAVDAPSDPDINRQRFHEFSDFSPIALVKECDWSLSYQRSGNDIIGVELGMQQRKLIEIVVTISPESRLP